MKDFTTIYTGLLIEIVGLVLAFLQANNLLAWSPERGLVTIIILTVGLIIIVIGVIILDMKGRI